MKEISVNTTEPRGLACNHPCRQPQFAAVFGGLGRQAGNHALPSISLQNKLSLSNKLALMSNNTGMSDEILVNAVLSCHVDLPNLARMSPEIV